jgi:L-methionine (R)-S-oxide reductase
MFKVEEYHGERKDSYELVIKQLESLLEGETNQLANLANAAALLKQFFNEVNWVGFYLNDGNKLVLWPFKGLPACVRIPFVKRSMWHRSK